MKIIQLKKLVEDNDINVIALNQGAGVSAHVFDVGSADYLDMAEWLVKGDYRIEGKPYHEAWEKWPEWSLTQDRKIQYPSILNVLHVEKLEKDLTITLNRPEIVAEDAPMAEEGEKEANAMNMVVTALVFNRGNLQSAGKEVMRKHTANFADAVIAKFNKELPEGAEKATYEDFAVMVIDWNNRTMWLESITEQTKEDEA